MKAKYKNLIGDHVRLTRTAHEPPISQAELAACVRKKGIFMDQASISRIENRTRSVSDFELLALADCLGVAITKLCGKATRAISTKAGCSIHLGSSLTIFSLLLD